MKVDGNIGGTTDGTSGGGLATVTGQVAGAEAASTANGDIGHFDADGILWFSDRRKDVIKTGGENVASIEVEKALYAADENIFPA
jgi:fatty-acyl-CoA synthase